MPQGPQSLDAKRDKPFAYPNCALTTLSYSPVVDTIGMGAYNLPMTSGGSTLSYVPVTMLPLSSEGCALGS